MQQQQLRSVAGTGSAEQLVEVGARPCGVAVAGEYVYWGEEGPDVGRAKLTGEDVEAEWITGAVGSTGVAVAGEYIYWTNYHGDISGAGTIGRAKLSDIRQAGRWR